jgi:proteasome accessory factor C
LPPTRTAERLRRLLALVPYAVRHPGTTLEELARVFEVNRAELMSDLNLLFVTGLPPYGPGDLVDVQIEGERVWISMADHFSRPVRLTRGEAIALYLGATALLGTEGPEAEALQGALKKLREALGGGGPEDLHLEVEQAAGRRGPLEAVREATEARERIEIDYYSASRDEVATRHIDPEQVFSAIGNWYVVAWDHVRDEERMFRVDRIREVRPTGQTFQTRGLLGQGRPLYDRSDQDVQVRLLLRPGARWVAEYYQVERAIPRGDDLEVVFPAKDLAWVAKLVLRLGGEAEVLDPPELRDLARRAADEALRLYRRLAGRSSR